MGILQASPSHSIGILSIDIALASFKIADSTGNFHKPLSCKVFYQMNFHSKDYFSVSTSL